MPQCDICTSLKSMEFEAITSGDLAKLRRVQDWIRRHEAEHEQRAFAAARDEAQAMATMAKPDMRRH